MSSALDRQVVEQWYLAQRLVDKASLIAKVGALEQECRIDFSWFAPGCVGVLLAFKSKQEAERYADGASIVEFIRATRTPPLPTPTAGGT